MNVIEQAKQAYAPAFQPIRSPRSIESQLLGQITAALSSALKAADFPQLVNALYENRRFWTTMAVDVADSENQLPQALRAQIFYLAEFTEQHSEKVLSGGAEANILVEVNTAILRGLLGEGAQK